jgi:hypothetical protein
MGRHFGGSLLIELAIEFANDAPIFPDSERFEATGLSECGNFANPGRGPHSDKRPNYPKPGSRLPPFGPCGSYAIDRANWTTTASFTRCQA